MPNRPAPLPTPRLPMTPVLSWASVARGRGARVPSILDAGPARLVTSGRIAIALALREMGIGPGDVVLVPAWHSLSMIPPVLWRGATPLFYKLGMDAAVDLDDVAAKLDARVKAIMVTHYFGVPQDIARIRAFCDAHGLLLLEDCAHCFFGEHAGRPVGSFGDYAIGSSMKFFPIFEGGCLVSARHALKAPPLRSAGLGFEAKIALASLENSFAHGRLAPVKAMLWLPMKLKDLAWRTLKARRAGAGAATAALAPSSSDSSAEFEPAWLDKRSSWFSRTMLRLVSRPRIVAQRRRNYQALQRALGGLPGCRPLYPALPDGACPWLFPMLVDEPDRLAARLKDAAVPVVRFGQHQWPGVDAAVCPNSAALAHGVLAFPCHQDLLPHELASMIARIAQALQP
ncbi:DegT/DnrJ/EryC1/StrS family aminotransferase [Massilia sp. R2A-15]|uniref:DegT/DnrJ/EryC1/StrS family aminotransferase n=1 Tax=Massilia sp. R2A-15 TaxID=3064278 RepID=UPI0027330E52|nr:DegT/DnrJ/EryC1/StrS family aminotransferase [Massilia sp. R2A-15]WLI88921.1 DegT/DnrJ/EryC1/StrS family aminotransferase [Massilia sp. R2A-15]